jgi:Flp pilus assembly pilin Flp
MAEPGRRIIQQTRTWSCSGSNLPGLGAPVRRTLVRLARDKGAATAIEYAMVASGVGLAVAATVMSLGSQLKSTFYDRLLGLF